MAAKCVLDLVPQEHEPKEIANQVVLLLIQLVTNKPKSELN